MKKYKSTGIQFSKYGVVGALNFGLSLVLYWILITVFNTNYLWAYTITWAFGMILTYSLNFTWVFKPTDKLNFKKYFLKYIVIYGSSFLLNFFALKYIVEHTSLNPIIVQFSLIPAVVVFNFLGMKFWSFK
jgi:putative flippase GtrA